MTMTTTRTILSLLVVVVFLCWAGQAARAHDRDVVATTAVVGTPPITTTRTLHEDGDNGNDGGTDKVMLEDFCHPTHTWKEMNDPVMGGESTGTFTIDSNQCLGRFIGQVVDVPFLHAPGFIQTRTTDSIVFPDVSHCEAIQVHCISHSSYGGYRISFGNAHPKGGKFFAYGYKANMNVVPAPPPSSSSPPTPNDPTIQIITIPFTDFTDFWDDATGDPIHTCHENNDYCPDPFTLKDMKRIAIWGEGVEGDVHLDVYKIMAVDCNDDVTR